MLISNAKSNPDFWQIYSNILHQYLAILLYSSESTEHSIAICTWLRLYDGSSAQGAYNFQVKRPFTSLKMVLVSLINYT